MPTFDKDFGDLAFRWGLPAGCGVILFRISIPSPEIAPEIAAQRALAELEARTDWPGHFAVIDDSRVRIRPLPETGLPGTGAR